jgi:hypothetical protein
VHLRSTRPRSSATPETPRSPVPAAAAARAKSWSSAPSRCRTVGLLPAIRFKELLDYSAGSLHAFRAADLVPSATAKTDGLPSRCRLPRPRQCSRWGVWASRFRCLWTVGSTHRPRARPAPAPAWSHRHYQELGLAQPALDEVVEDDVSSRSGSRPMSLTANSTSGDLGKR